jgi:hypothetical protein
MIGTGTEGVRSLVREALHVYGDAPAQHAVLERYARRLDEPLRVAVAGMVKAGKSTLLNAILGEEIAPTDAGECTRVVTWYRYSDTPRITLYPHGGQPRALPVRRARGRLVFDLDPARAEDIERLVVDWPAKALRGLTLIDTPGIASLSADVSARSARFLTPTDAPSEADAIIYLMRHLHASDLNFLQAFRDHAAGCSGTVNALAVLSRADEIGAGRIDSLISAREIAQRYSGDETLRALVMGVVPIAGLVAQSARTLRQAEFAALAQLGRLDRPARERMMLSADRFVLPSPELDVSPEERQELLERFGMFGIRLALALLRGGIDDPTVLAEELVRRSGLEELLRLLAGQFQARSDQLKSRTVMAGVESLLREHPRQGTAELARSLEMLQDNAHEFRELRLLATARTEGLDLAPELAAEAERLVGGHGVTPAERLGLARDSSPDVLRAGALSCLHRWRAMTENPLTSRRAAESCEIVARSCEAILAGGQDGSGPFPVAHLGLGPEPGPGSGQQTDGPPRTRRNQLSHQE